MQATCLVFPSPKKFTIQPILKNIILISQDCQYHMTYENYLNNNNQLSLSESYGGKDQFEKVIRRLKCDNDGNQRLQESKGGRMWKTKDNSKVEEGNVYNSMVNQDILRYQGQQNIYMSKSNIINTNSEHSNINKKSILYKTITNSNQPLKQHTSLLQLDSQQFIPCLFLPGVSSKLLIFFHANAQDITSSYQFLRMINLQTKHSILAMQYRGYSLSHSSQTDPIKIKQDALNILKYLTQQRQIQPNKIIVFGRSIGCAIALSVIQKYQKVYALILLSPFVSLKKIAEELYGNCAGWVLKQGFNNEELVTGINCPVLLIHGMKDTLVPYEHSMALFEQCKGYCQIKLVENMTHSRFNFRTDFIFPFIKFIRQLQDSQTILM